jgi:hypothetical protein
MKVRIKYEQNACLIKSKKFVRIVFRILVCFNTGSVSRFKSCLKYEITVFDGLYRY